MSRVGEFLRECSSALYLSKDAEGVNVHPRESENLGCRGAAPRPVAQIVVIACYISPLLLVL